MGFLRRDKRTLNERLLDNLGNGSEPRPDPEPQPVEDGVSSGEPTPYWDVMVDGGG